MQTVTFRCGRCTSLIAVEEERLGRQVRCPYCHGVVLPQLPAEAGASGPVAIPSTEAESASSLPSTDPVPDAFPTTTQPVSESAVAASAATVVAGDEVSRDEFAPPAVSSAELSNESLPLLSIADEGLFPPMNTATAPGVPSMFDAADPFPFAGADSAHSESTAAPLPGDTVREAQVAITPGSNDVLESPFLANVSESSASMPRGERRPGRVRSGVSIWLVLPLVSYSVLATILVVVLWNRLQAVEVHPLIAFLPDAEGDAPGVIRKPKAVNEARKRRLIGDPLPEGLKMRLGQTRVIGSLAVTAQRVTREQAGTGTGLAEPEKLKELSLVLHLHLQNVSTDESFQPLDRYFDRKWREGSPGAPPLTLLEAGKGQRFYGGPAEWRPRHTLQRNNDAAAEFIYLLGSDKPIEDPIDHTLDPGETADVFVCTDGNDPRSDELVHRTGEFLWRVHVRRGLVRVRGQDIPAAAVLGVAFNDREIGG
jgi:DNA-directed RNA polymerase subunit RPC12/RpoP